MLDQVRSAVKLSRSRLQEFDTPDAIALDGDDGLMRVDGGIEVHLAWWYHPDDGAEDGDFWTQQTQASDFTDVGGSDMVGKDLPKRRSDVHPPPVIWLPSNPMTAPSSVNGAAKASALRWFQPSNSSR